MTLRVSFTGEVYRLHKPRETAHTSEVIRLAREAEVWIPLAEGPEREFELKRLGRLIALAKAEEREGCKAAVSACRKDGAWFESEDLWIGHDHAVDDCLEALEVRAQEGKKV